MIQVNMYDKENASITINGSIDTLMLEFEAITQGIVSYLLYRAVQNNPEMNEKTIFNMLFPKLEIDLAQAFERGISLGNEVSNIECEEGK